MHGQGIKIFQNGNYYEGTFVEGQMHGKGRFKWINGDEYIGEYKNNNKNGKGRFIKKDGPIFEGSFVDGKMHGVFKLFHKQSILKSEFYQGKKVINKEIVQKIDEDLNSSRI